MLNACDQIGHIKERLRRDVDICPGGMKFAIQEVCNSSNLLRWEINRNVSPGS